MRATSHLPTQQVPSKGRGHARRRRTKPRLPGMRRNARRVPTVQRVRTFYRLFRYLLRWFRPLAMMAILFLLLRFGWSQFSQSSQFGLKKVIATGSIPQQELIRFAGLRFGTNLLKVDLKQLTKRLQQHPQIKSVKVRRQFPNTLHIQVTTHQAVAVAELGGALYYLDKMGRVFARLPSSKAPQDKLLISGVSRADYEQSPQATQRLFRQSLALAKEYKRRKLSKYQPLTEIQYDPILGYILCTGHGKIYIGDDHFPDRIKQLHRIYRLFGQRGIHRFRYVRLDHKHHPRRAIVKLDDAIVVTKPKASNHVVQASLTGH